MNDTNIISKAWAFFPSICPLSELAMRNFFLSLSILMWEWRFSLLESNSHWINYRNQEREREKEREEDSGRKREKERDETHSYSYWNGPCFVDVNSRSSILVYETALNCTQLILINADTLSALFVTSQKHEFTRFFLSVLRLRPITWSEFISFYCESVKLMYIQSQTCAHFLQSNAFK